VKQGIGKGGRAGPEAHFGTAGALANLLAAGYAAPQVIGLLVDVAVATDGQQQLVDSAFTTETPTPCRPPDTL
jgi:hypothetical protein